MSVMSLTRPPLPPFTFETAVQKVRRAEDAWNTCNPEQVSLAYTVDSYWRNRAESIQGRTAIVEFLTRKWVRELDYRLIKELWAWEQDRIAVRFAYEWHDEREFAGKSRLGWPVWSGNRGLAFGVQVFSPASSRFEFGEA